jgi:hypothetical protein
MAAVMKNIPFLTDDDDDDNNSGGDCFIFVGIWGM